VISLKGASGVDATPVKNFDDFAVDVEEENIDEFSVVTYLVSS
jgi:hypothetical protein